MRRTKIVCTLGPAVDSPENLDRLIRAGMDVARFNFSHGTHAQHQERFIALRAAAERAGKPVAILQDLCGPKIRLGELSEGTLLHDEATFVLDDDPTPGDATRACLPVPELRAALCCGDTLLIDDGLLSLKVTEATASRVVTQVVSGGPLSSKKGIAAPGVVIPIEAVTPKDIADVKFGLSLGVDFVALSFVRSAADVHTLRAAMAGSDVPILVKIEKGEAVQNLDEILDAADGAMVARGDLGVELPIEEVAGVQKKVIRACNLRGKPVITATQMLDSMIRNPRPTRAEVTDIANAILDGTDALMLSGETAVGEYPIAAVETMARIAHVTERDFDWDATLQEKQRLFGRESVTDAVADAVATIAHDQGATAILCATTSGGTARAVAKFRPKAPIFAATTSPTIQRRMNLLYGVTPLQVPIPASLDELLTRTVEAATEAGQLPTDALVVLTSGTPVGVAGTTNLIKVHYIGQPL
ncbi:MAG: pyruvate kinase [Armatimonas sp.]